jgi:hypothetical protein
MYGPGSAAGTDRRGRSGYGYAGSQALFYRKEYYNPGWNRPLIYGRLTVIPYYHFPM